MSDTVKFQYSSYANISFRGEHDSGYTKEEWEELTAREQSYEVNDFLNELVDVSVEVPDE